MDKAKFEQLCKRLSSQRRAALFAASKQLSQDSHKLFRFRFFQILLRFLGIPQLHVNHR